MTSLMSKPGNLQIIKFKINLYYYLLGWLNIKVFF